MFFTKKGATVTFTASFNIGGLLIFFSWFSGDDSAVAVQVRGGPEKHMVTGWVQIMEVTKKTAGTYVCIASNSEGEDRKAATIKLSGKWTISSIIIIKEK